MNDMVELAAQPRRSFEVRREAFSFTGTSREYFGIWIVNVLLTIVTLGIYSAWAKVRRQRYFYGNTHLAGSSFDYHARPGQILIGRIIVLGLLVLYNVTLQFVPIVGGLIGVSLLFALPWFVMRGLRFSARVTSYRNVRFDFTGGYWGAFQAYLLGGALIYVTGGILAPLASRWMWGYMLGNLRYGDRPISCDPRLEKLYGQWWLPAGVLLGGSVLLISLGIAAAVAYSPNFLTLMGVDEPGKLPPYVFILLVYAALIPLALLYMLCRLLYSAGTRNVALSETVIDGRHVLASSIGRWRYAWISMSNLVATLFTLGLARPWAAIRMAKYIATVTALDSTGSLDDYFSSVQSSGAAVGAEFMDVEGFDLGF